VNDFYTAPAAPVDFTRARAAQIRQQFEAIEAAFDKLPAREALFGNTLNYAVAAGTADTITAEMQLAPTEYVDGLNIDLRILATNTGAATLNIDGLGAVPIHSNAGVALAGGELVAGTVVPLVYVEGAFRLPATGPEGPEGPVGPPNGSTILNGAVAPSGGVGANGDFYIEVVAGVPTRIYGPKAAGAWPAGVVILGEDGDPGDDGAPGNSVLTGSGAPDGGDGNDGDVYFDLDAPGMFYGPKAGGVWPAGVSLKGDPGDEGDPGTMDTSDIALTGVNTVNPHGTAHEIGFRGLPKSRTVTGTFTLDNDDRGHFIEYTGAGGHDCEIVPNSTEAIETGAIITVVNNGTGTLTADRGSGVTMKLMGTGTNANRTIGVGGYATLHKIATNTWFIGGPGVT
jgi:hypothetical protein